MRCGTLRRALKPKLKQQLQQATDSKRLRVQCLAQEAARCGSLRLALSRKLLLLPSLRSKRTERRGMLAAPSFTSSRDCTTCLETLRRVRVQASTTTLSAELDSVAVCGLLKTNKEEKEEETAALP
jgi:hypothetical protein